MVYYIFFNKLFKNDLLIISFNFQNGKQNPKP